jgi:hypothetical protein
MTWFGEGAHFNFLICPLLAVPKFTPPTCLYMCQSDCGCIYARTARVHAPLIHPPHKHNAPRSRRRAHGDDFSRVLTPHWALCTIHSSQYALMHNQPKRMKNERWCYYLMCVSAADALGRNNSICWCRLNDWLCCRGRYRDGQQALKSLNAANWCSVNIHIFSYHWPELHFSSSKPFTIHSDKYWIPWIKFWWLEI